MAPSNTPISIRIFHNILVSGSPVEGEVELNFRGLQEDSIDEVHVKLRGVVRTSIRRDKHTHVQTIPIVRSDASLWCRGSAYPPPGSDILRIPFRLPLPPYVPPSFQYSGVNRKASIRYSVTIVGVRPGTFQFNRRIFVPIAVVPADAAGAAVRDNLTAIAAAGVECEWRTQRKEEKIRRGLWGEYSTVRVQVPVFPLFMPIPFVIKVKSVSAPLTREKADALPHDKPAFPPVPSTYGQMTFKLYSKIWMKARGHTESPSADVTVFARAAASQIEEDVPLREWVPLETAEGKRAGEASAEAKGSWVQYATFRSLFHLDCPPTFAIDTLQCEYLLSLRVPFPGIGNDVHISVPIMVTSGLNAPIVRGRPDGNGPMVPLDLPPAYWDANDHEWEDIKD